MSEREQLEQAISHLEAQHATLGDVAVDAALVGLRQKLVALGQAEETGAPTLAAAGFFSLEELAALEEPSRPSRTASPSECCGVSTRSSLLPTYRAGPSLPRLRRGCEIRAGSRKPR
jgi:hypothetical protein